ncbi:hypothetical protein GCM10010331_68930 [Streptomyces xanthochromogenes]|nr:hypothetical protein GCM10010331_68930 [Streptomyces xanthochromogenes]
MTLHYRGPLASTAVQLTYRQEPLAAAEIGNDRAVTARASGGARQATSQFVEKPSDEDMANPASRHAIVNRVYAPAKICTTQDKLDEGYRLANRAMGLDQDGPPRPASTSRAAPWSRERS